MSTMGSTMGSTIGLITSTWISDEDPEKMAEKRNSLIKTSFVSGATILGAQTVNNTRIKEIHEKYATTYVESMSEDELVAALEQLDLLEASMTNNNYTKTI